MGDDKIAVMDKPPEPQDTEKPAQEETVYAGKYKSVEDFEKGHDELGKKYGEQTNAIGTLKKENQGLVDQLTAFQQEAKDREEAALNAEPPTDYEQNLSDVAKRYDEGDITYEESLRLSNSITLQMAKAQFAQEKAALLDETKNVFQSEMANRDSQVAQQKFHEQNPDFQGLSDAGVLNQIMEQDPMHDQVSAYWFHKAATAKQEGLDEAARIQSGSDKTAKVLGDTGTAMQTPRQSGKPKTEAEMKASMMESLT